MKLLELERMLASTVLKKKKEGRRTARFASPGSRPRGKGGPTTTAGGEKTRPSAQTEPGQKGFGRMLRLNKLLRRKKRNTPLLPLRKTTAALHSPPPARRKGPKAYPRRLRCRYRARRIFPNLRPLPLKGEGDGEGGGLPNIRRRRPSNLCVIFGGRHRTRNGDQVRRKKKGRQIGLT